MAAPRQSENVTSAAASVRADSRRVAHSAVWNLIGRAGPILIGFIITPYLFHALGPTRWGIFTLAISLVGVFGIFDFGIANALTRLIAVRLGHGEEAEAASLVMTGILMLAGLGLAGAVVAGLTATLWVDSNSIRGAAGLHDEVLNAVYVLCASAPLVILNAAMWGVVATFQKFRTANLISIPIAAMYYIGPMLMLQVWDSLTGVMLALVLCRVAMTVGLWYLCIDAMPALRHARPRWDGLLPLVRFGGWMTVSNFTSPILSYMDRFVIAGVLSAAATGYYTTPFDLVTRFSILTMAIIMSAYPAMAASSRVDPGRTVTLFRHSILATVSILFPACLIVVGFSEPLLTLWLGQDFATHAAPVLRWIGIGIMVRSADIVVSSLIDGIGRPDANAKLSLLELALSVPLLIVLLYSFGIEGAAITWSVRCTIDLFIRLRIAVRLYPPVASAVALLWPTIIAGTGLLILTLMVPGTIARCVMIAVAILAYWILILRLSCTPDERGKLWLLSQAVMGRRPAPSYYK
jgi:O-antigen/teichoic acid export membrane protein